MPPRSIADATRFTPTGPHAFTPSSGATPGETAQQRVARLREASRRLKAEQQAGSWADRLIDRGRVWADRAHRITAVGLIAATVLAGGVTVYATVDMMMFNRKKRAELAEKRKLEQAAGVLPEAADVNAAASASTAVAAAVADSSRNTATNEPGKVKGPVEVVKNWALKGLTPADQEIKTVFDKKEEEVLRSGPVVEIKETVEKAKGAVEGEAKKKGWFW